MQDESVFYSARQAGADIMKAVDVYAHELAEMIRDNCNCPSKGYCDCDGAADLIDPEAS
ncbi:hypothetical protein [Streptomyces sp. CC53]|uniref:hypothetical protein n=1 Tax=Streptomyces sp. CC53 TaxID=1906740 RepID=UPI0015A6526F|nr:hypothetical protein [Streptomyces sp. CC53]